jgi:hypothetical protein
VKQLLTKYLINFYGGAVQTTALGKPESTEFEIWFADRNASTEFAVQNRLFLPQSGNPVLHNFLPYIQVTQKTDIKITAAPVSDSAAPFAGFDLILVDNG